MLTPASFAPDRYRGLFYAIRAWLPDAPYTRVIPCSARSRPVAAGRRAPRPLRFNAFPHFELSVFDGHDDHRLARVALFVPRDVPGYTREIFGGSKRVPNFGRFRRSSSPDGIGQQTGAVVPQGSQGIRTGSVLSFISLNKSSD